MPDAGVINMHLWKKREKRFFGLVKQWTCPFFFLLQRYSYSFGWISHLAAVHVEDVIIGERLISTEDDLRLTWDHCRARPAHIYHFSGRLRAYSGTETKNKQTNTFKNGHGRKSRNQACNKRKERKKLVISISPKAVILDKISFSNFSLFRSVRKYCVGMLSHTYYYTTERSYLQPDKNQHSF